ncbi:flagellar biosynthesis protein FlhB [Aestuariibacter sp. GS-14]|uniref:EscU/YscU/HrcU family type III secretion system export apparatus switch protein n=1 Tax=Alteromonadaceae TaxID=72275 RepID=UPI00112D1F66|nr:EscU/YscU/HrcU family type III secretion system export apparatus switch protein [Aestuariibacter sp. GS-14]TPV56098.1 flagellar biosynthesis protein FlhB [Aestuariibacter sp. GS-14]
MTNKSKRAVGIKYNETDGDTKPTIVAKGYGDLAEAIIASAQQNGVLIHEDPYLSEFLTTLDLGQSIPESLYYVIAELLAYSYVLQGKIPESWKQAMPGIEEKI